VSKPTVKGVADTTVLPSRRWLGPLSTKSTDDFRLDLKLELARIGSQLFVFDSATCDQTASLPLFVTCATCLSAQPLSVVSLGDVDLGPLLAAFGGVLSIFVTLSLPHMRPAGSARQVVLRK